MRFDSLSPRTWLLAGVAGWAVCLWVFALAGLGGRLGKLPDDVEPQRLPATKLPAAERPGPPAQYVAIGLSVPVGSPDAFQSVESGPTFEAPHSSAWVTGPH